MKNSCKKGRGIPLANRDSGGFLKHLVDVQDRAISRQDRDRLANGIDHRTKIFLTFPQLLLGALAVVDIGARTVPADDLAVFVLQRVVLNQPPPILSVLHQKARVWRVLSLTSRIESPVVSRNTLFKYRIVPSGARTAMDWRMASVIVRRFSSLSRSFCSARLRSSMSIDVTYQRTILPDSSFNGLY